jgi:hypothetical protein
MIITRLSRARLATVTYCSGYPLLIEGRVIPADRSQLRLR